MTLTAGILLLATPVPAHAVGETVVLWEVQGLGIDEAAIRPISGMLTGELRRLLGERAESTTPWVDADTRAEVNSCTKLRRCIVDAAAALGADQVITGVVSELGDQYSLALKLISVPDGEEIGKASAGLSGDQDEALEAIDQLLVELVAPDRLTGSVELDVAQEGLEVYIDGELTGTTPLAEPVQGLAPGQHALKLTSPDIEDYVAFFTVYSNKTTSVVADIDSIQVVRLGAGPLAWLGFALKGGYSSNFGKVDAPVGLGAISVEILLEGLRLTLESGYRRSTSGKRLEGLGERARVTLWVVPMVLRVGYHFELAELFGIEIGAGGGAYLVGTELSATSLPPSERVTMQPAYNAALTFSLRLGPGALLVEAQWAGASVDGGSITGNVGGLTGVAGYRLGL